MSKLLPICPKELMKVLDKLGFKLVRQKGSHVFFKHSDGRCTTLTVHEGELIGCGLLRKILNDIELSRDEWLELVGK